MSRTTVEDGPTTNVVITHSGYQIDMNNFPGKLRAILVKRGEMNADSIGLPPNMPGKKLLAIREEMRARAREALKTTGFTVGELIKYNDVVYDIKKIEDEKIYIERPSSKNPDKMTLVGIPIAKVIRVLIEGDHKEG